MARAVVPLCFAWMLATSPAGAQDDRARADALFKEGRAATNRGDHALACAKFSESFALDRAAGTLINLSLCQEQTGKLVSARAGFERVVEWLPSDDPREQFARDHLEAVDRRIAKLTLTLAPGTPATSIVRQDGEVVSARTFGAPRLTDPGKHQLTVEGVDGRRSTVQVELAEGEAKSLVLSLPASGVTAEAAVDARPEGGGGMKTAALVIGGVGVASLAASMITGALAWSKKGTVDERCSGEVCADQEGADASASGRTLAIVSTVTFFVGVAGVGTGVVLLVASPDPSSSGMGLRVRGAF